MGYDEISQRIHQIREVSPAGVALNISIIVIEKGIDKIMLRVVIADDEYSIIQLVKNLIDSQDVQVVGEAFNGIQAYEEVCKNKPDVLITDIRMPGITGIELIEKAKKDFSNLNVIVISGYQEFEDARNALKFGAREYLLKPIKKVELNAVLSKLSQEKMGENQERNHIQQMTEKLEKSLQVLRSEFLAKVLVDDTQLTGKAKELYNFRGDFFCIALLKIDTYEIYQMNMKQMVSALENLCLKMSLILRSYCCDVEYIIKDTVSYWLLNYENGFSSNVFTQNSQKKMKEKVTEMLINESYKYSFLKFTLVMGEETTVLTGLKKSYEKANIALEKRINFKDSLFFSYDALDAKFQTSCNLRIPDEKRSEFRHNCEIFDIDEAIASLNKLIEEDIELFGEVSFIYSLIDQVLSYLMNLFDQQTVTGKNAAQDIAKFKTQIRNIANFELIKEAFLDYLKKCILDLKEQQNNKDSKPIRIIKEYIEQHYNEPVSLDDIARLVYLSPSYISTAFKLQVGVSFSAYLIQVRLDKAKELLKDTVLNISEIAQQVGYTDVKHFSKLFKKIAGINPIEYRKFYS